MGKKTHTKNHILMRNQNLIRMDTYGGQLEREWKTRDESNTSMSLHVVNYSCEF